MRPALECRQETNDPASRVVGERHIGIVNRRLTPRASHSRDHMGGKDLLICLDGTSCLGRWLTTDLDSAEEPGLIRPPGRRVGRIAALSILLQTGENRDASSAELTRRPDG